MSLVPMQIMAKEVGQHRPHKIPKKQIKIEDEEEDRISWLPDCLLIEIISCLNSTKEAIKTSTLSKRWQHLWTQVPNLIYINDKSSFYSRRVFFSFLDRNISQCHKVKLNKFHLKTKYDSRYESHVNKCIRYAISCNVQDFELSLKCDREISYFIDLDGLLFINSHFTRLKLPCCMLNPTGVISWNKLTSLCISNGKLGEDTIQNILCGSPLLETLNLYKCYGFRRVDITSKSVKKLVLSGYANQVDNYMEIEIDAPNILSLTIQKNLVLWRLVLLNVYSLVVTTLDYTTDTFFVKSDKNEEDMLKGLILSLSHAKELKLGYSCSKVLSRLVAQGFTVPSNIKYHDILTTCGSSFTGSIKHKVSWSQRR